MTEDVIGRYETFNTKGCPDELFLGYFNDQPIPSNYYNILNDDDDYGNNITGTPVDNALLDNELVEDAVVPNDEDINYEIIIDDDDSLASDIDPPPPPKKTKFWKFKEWKMKLKEGKFKEWTQKMKEWTQKMME